MTEAASPQLEDGYIRIANELFDAILRARLKYSTQTVLLAVMRKTYGYGKKEDDVSASQLGALCGMSRPHVAVALNELAVLGVIHKREGKYGTIVGVNKNYAAWMVNFAPTPDAETKQYVRTLDAANEKRHHYVYKITEPRTGQFYIGVRSCDCLPAQDRYMGSGGWIAMIDKRTAHKEILEVFGSREEAEVAEIFHIKHATGKIMNRRLYASTDCEQGCTDSVHVQNSSFTSTDSVQVASTDSVHTKDNLPKDNKQKTCASAGAFARFWSAYPKKRSKGQAEKAFQKIKPNEQLLDAMLVAIERAKTSDDWQKAGGQFIPYPATWLNAKGWEDEGLDEVESGCAWWQAAGFSSLYEAENAGCNQFIYQQFQDGKKVEAHA